MTHDEYVELLKATLLSQLKKTVLQILFKKVTFLAWGPLAPIVSLVVEKVLTIAIYQGELAIYLLYTDFRVAKQGRDFNKAIEANLEAQKNGTEDEKLNAEQKLKDSFINLARLTF